MHRACTQPYIQAQLSKQIDSETDINAAFEALAKVKQFHGADSAESNEKTTEGDGEAAGDEEEDWEAMLDATESAEKAKESAQAEALAEAQRVETLFAALGDKLAHLHFTVRVPSVCSGEHNRVVGVEMRAKISSSREYEGGVAVSDMDPNSGTDAYGAPIDPSVVRKKSEALLVHDALCADAEHRILQMSMPFCTTRTFHHETTYTVREEEEEKVREIIARFTALWNKHLLPAITANVIAPAHTASSSSSAQSSSDAGFPAIERPPFKSEPFEHHGPPKFKVH